MFLVASWLGKRGKVIRSWDFLIILYYYSCLENNKNALEREVQNEAYETILESYLNWKYFYKLSNQPINGTSLLLNLNL